MVDKWGKLSPFRITGSQFVDLATQLDNSLPKFEAQRPYDYRFQVTFDNLLKYCTNLDDLKASLTEVGRKVIREFHLIVFCPPPSGADPRYLEHVDIQCGPGGARYAIGNAPSAKDADALERAITGFRDRHSTNTLSRPWAGYLVCWALFMMLLFDTLCVSFCWSFRCPSLVPTDFWEGYRPLHIVLWVSGISIIGYVIWSYFAKDSPSGSFRHAILYVDQEPRSNVFWILVSSILIAIFCAVIVSFLMRA
jgi:hypothetical protein